MATKQQSKQPANTLRCGNITATIWENVSEKGPFFATTFSRPFKDQSGAWPTAPRSVSMTWRPCWPWLVRPRSGSRLSRLSAELLHWEASGLPGASLHGAASRR